ncbi:MAG: peroxidase family protein, partial [bacterium]
MNKHVGGLLLGIMVFLGGCGSNPGDLISCLQLTFTGLRPIADDRSERFLGKVQEATARCRGGDRAVGGRHLPWIDWASYWATGDASSRAAKATFNIAHLSSNGRGIDGALLDLEYQRIELIKFNLFDNNGTYKDYVSGRDGVAGSAL